VKKVKYTRVFIGGNPPMRTRKEREKVYQFLEVTGFLKKLMAGSEVILTEER
jgi:hypothetical protein